MLRAIIATAAVVLTSIGVASPAEAASTVLFAPAFANTNALVTNEYAMWNASRTDAVKSADWEMTSGSLFSATGTAGGVGFTGKVDNQTPDARSVRNTDNAVFRLNTKRRDFGNVNVRFKLNLESMTSTPTTPAKAWDGVHIWMRYASEQSLYYASVARRDGKVLIKKKCPGGPSNGGTYHTLTKEISGFPISFKTWWYVSATVKNNANGTVTITLYQNDQAITSVTDSGTGCAPITQPGAVGIRGDNSKFRFDVFAVRTA